MNLTAYIVDDERHAITVLAAFIGRTPGLSLAGSSVSPLSALSEMEELLPDIVFLDIDMEELNGLEMARLVSPRTRVVLTTSYREYGPEAYALSVADYLLKPVSYERFLACVQKLRQVTGVFPADKPSPFFVKTGSKGKLEKIDPAQLFYIEGALNYVHLYLAGAKVVTYMSVTDVLDLLPAGQFIRVHKSFIVNLHQVSAVEQNHILLPGGAAVPIGRAYREVFWSAIRGRIAPGR